MNKELLNEIRARGEDYGENWVFEKKNDWDDEFKNYLLSLSYEKFEHYLNYTCEDSFLLPIDYDAIFDNLSVDYDDVNIFLSNEIFSFAVKGAYDYLHKL